ncbi:reverse transcriptase family protein [Alloalcanivorax venustensis]|uniref:reverse transcriptase family protein n=1 Tax=Alloalcanivorax venustensis TaxID=172371 RepID=UPI003519CA6E
MDRWNPNLYSKEGLRKGYNPEYLEKLVKQGNKIDSHRVPVIYSLSHLANYSNTLYSDLHAFVARSNIHQKNYPYKNFPISKRRGGKRWISIPVPALMAVQLWINQGILDNIPPHPAAYAFVKGKKSPLKAHAERHCGSDWILKLDIKNFFSNISERQVFDVFRSLNYPDLISFEMARLCTRATPGRVGSRWNAKWKDYNVQSYFCRNLGSLPQGAPTSPALSNLVFRSIDDQLDKLSKDNNVTYSRYADDLCFSFSQSNREVVYKFKKLVSRVLWENSFTENNKKTRIIPPGARKVVTGLVVNDDMPRIPKELRDTIRLHLYCAEKNGIPDHCKKRGFRSVIGLRNHLSGLIMYACSIEPIKGEQFRQKFNQLPWLDFEI